MRRALLAGAPLAIALLAGAPARADKKAPPPSTAKAADAKAPKVKTYDFGGLDVEGRMRTPQLLYFLQRMQAEFDQTAPDKRSFMPELARTVDEM